MKHSISYQNTFVTLNFCLIIPLLSPCVCVCWCSVLKVASQGSPDVVDSSSPMRQRGHPSPSPVRGTRNSTPTKDDDDH